MVSTGRPKIIKAPIFYMETSGWKAVVSGMVGNPGDDRDCREGGALRAQVFRFSLWASSGSGRFFSFGHPPSVAFGPEITKCVKQSELML